MAERFDGVDVASLVLIGFWGAVYLAAVGAEYLIRRGAPR